LAELAGIPVASDKPLDGTSVAGLLTGKSSELPERTIFSHWNNKVSARFGKYRLDNGGKLYDLTNDPGQRHDLSKQEPELAKKLRREVADWRRDVLGELLRDESDDRPLTVGYNEARPTPLPARHIDAIADVCHLSPEEVRRLLAAYRKAHPEQDQEAGGHHRHYRTLHIQIPVLDDPVRQQRLEALIKDNVRRLCDLLHDG